jgi:hypothetical protein
MGATENNWKLQQSTEKKRTKRCTTIFHSEYAMKKV